MVVDRGMCEKETKQSVSNPNPHYPSPRLAFRSVDPRPSPQQDHKKPTVGEDGRDLPVQEECEGVGRGDAHPAVEVECGHPREGAALLVARRLLVELEHEEVDGEEARDEEERVHAVVVVVCCLLPCVVLN